LKQVQVDILKRLAAEVFGPQPGLMFFGFRADDTRRGGDVDLYVTGVNEPMAKLLDEKRTGRASRYESMGNLRGFKLTPAYQGKSA
jgi:hypothetical protein